MLCTSDSFFVQQAEIRMPWRQVHKVFFLNAADWCFWPTEQRRWPPHSLSLPVRQNMTPERGFELKLTSLQIQHRCWTAAACCTRSTTTTLRRQRTTALGAA